MTKPAKEKVPLSTHLIAGGVAGAAEALVCHPLDTIKVRMQLSKSRQAKGLKPLGFYQTGKYIIGRESVFGLYKGLGAVLSGIVPKMAIRFASFEQYKLWLGSHEGTLSPGKVFIAGLGAGTTEAVAVVTPMEVVKIRLQSQQHSMMDPLDVPKYRNAAHALYTIVKDEGISTLYRGVSLTALRQATNQGANFTAYQQLKAVSYSYQPQYNGTELPSWQTVILGLISGAAGPLTNAPIDTIKTRIQKAQKVPGETAISRLMGVATDMWKQEGVASFYKGIAPRILRVAPGQAVVFSVFEKVKPLVERMKGEYLYEPSDN
ncbi:putative succinate:fumarate antiporter [Wallemia mellicola]|uniref:Succinate:fumarate antiporter n=2 Tax=Wallemia mellicola TaxID=1708541 RepID=A0A4T0MXR5_9BASI|nr:putative succinate:fumarate antiporter [Wallemia mellicola CBS 633.66]TIB71816.1 hypothetical protein E3Q24_02121 [Wallemia mellicola]EIM21323.1 putative succinate:fumarate antiporter [Wallemia mellicola CBS 633.66]TIB76451.1 hypothetical protein E3Q23_01839 [Wallemia mellicola]TIB81400.1 putative succinate:fumarate antiporter [Wallemia mellicola]TIB88770.1 putative succinate:fumarate antiporter [Wallemia mellicola]|eukprot:XP_006958580.1 putative succinate:fumarate antiporter [Wallemia mellicola CBS 633.66]